jgi:AraC family transcriptional regulator, regulatory protein of adaptative response / methylated-DNA-[protein]-cysteine methyltransferase
LSGICRKKPLTIHKKKTEILYSCLLRRHEYKISGSSHQAAYKELFLRKNRVENRREIAYNVSMSNIPIPFSEHSQDYTLVERAIGYIEVNASRQPELDEIAAAIGLSAYHFQRLFTRWVGISPKRFLQYISKENAKQMLKTSGDILGAAYATGLSGPGRLHDLLVHTEAATPGDLKRRGEGLNIRYGFHSSPFGECLLALTERGICYLGFVQSDKPAALAILQSDWPNAVLAESPEETAAYIPPLFQLTDAPEKPLALHLAGTNFQIKVWEALLNIAPGQVSTYQRIAAGIGYPQSARAVGNAIAHNKIAWLIPCHRVIRKEGAFGNYRYGLARKKAMLGWESGLAEGTT